MAQTPQKRGPEPWLKPQKKGSQAMALKVFRAMAQTPKKWGPEPWLKLNFVLHILTSVFDSNKHLILILSHQHLNLPIFSSIINQILYFRSEKYFYFNVVFGLCLH